MNQQIKKVVFINSFTNPESVKKLEPLPTVAMIGRSNVGKSTFINAIVDSRSIAKTGKTPGKTRLINYFLVNDQYYFVDLPGYGYAKISKTERRNLTKMINDYLKCAPGIKLITQLFDIRIGATEQDIEYFNMMFQTQIPILLIANKSDKISKNRINDSLKKIAKQLEVEVLPTPNSSTKKDQTELIRSLIFERLQMID